MPPSSTTVASRSLKTDQRHMRRALALARRALGQTRPNPMVGAVLVRRGRVLGEGWHHRAGEPHAEIEALRDAERRNNTAAGATLYVTLEPCCTQGRTPPCTEAIIAAGISRVVVAATDPNPAHAGHGFGLLRQAGIEVDAGLLEKAATQLNLGFNQWIQHHTPHVTLKAALSLDGKIATVTGESRWITGPASRKRVMEVRASHDAILVGINTVLADDPSLTIRIGHTERAPVRVILDSKARTPLGARMLIDPYHAQTLIVVGEAASKRRIEALRSRVTVWTAPVLNGRIDLRWLMAELGRYPVTSLLVEGGGEVHASFLESGLAHRAVFFYGPKVIGGAQAPRGVGGKGFQSLATAPHLVGIRHRRLGNDLMVQGRIEQLPAAEPAVPKSVRVRRRQKKLVVGEGFEPS